MIFGHQFHIIGELLDNIIGVMFVIKFGLVIDLNVFCMLSTMMFLVLLMVLDLSIVALVIFMEPSGVVTIWRKLCIM